MAPALAQSTLLAYSDAAACGTFDAAYEAASLGDLTLIKAGTYGNQTIDATKASAVLRRLHDWRFAYRLRDHSGGDSRHGNAAGSFYPIADGLRIEDG